MQTGFTNIDIQSIVRQQERPQVSPNFTLIHLLVSVSGFWDKCMLIFMVWYLCHICEGAMEDFENRIVYFESTYILFWKEIIPEKNLI